MRPTILHVNGTLYWVIRTYNPDTSVLKDADSTPTVAVRKNGASTGDSVTVTKRSATTGIYDCSYNPASEVEGDEFVIEETATVTGTTTAQATYSQSWSFTVIATVNEMSNAILSRNVSNVETTMPEHCLGTVVLAMLEHSISGATLTIKGTDGSTSRFTKTLTTNAAADPITGIQ
jgi:hypothetical protein